MPLQYQQQKEWSNGITDDRFLGRWYCGDAEGVNLRRQSRGVFLSNNTRETGIYDTSFMGAGSAYRQYGMWEFKSGGTNDILYALYDDGAIDTTTGTFFTYAGAFAGGRNITKVVSAGVNYWVLARSQGTNGVRRWNDDSSSIWTAAATVSLSNNTSDYRPILV